MKSYRVHAAALTKPQGVVAEEIIDLAQALRGSSASDPKKVIQLADSIMHLAADIRATAEINETK